MANHATGNTTNNSSLPPTIQTSAVADHGDRSRPPRLAFRRNLEMDQDRTTSPPRLPPTVPARPGPGAAIRISSSGVTGTATASRLATSSVHPSLPPQLMNVTPIQSSRNQTLVAAESEVFSLSQPRPDGERARNEYIETPLKGGINRQIDLFSSTPLHAETHIHFRGSPHDHLALVPIGGVSSKSLPFTSTAPFPSSPSLKRLQKPRRSLPITNQSAPTFAKESAPAFNSFHRQGRTNTTGEPAAAAAALVSQTGAQVCSVNSGSVREDSIICPVCSQCRCQSCRTPRALPSKWLCGDKCLCSAESVVDYVSCLCCVKGLFYHCGSLSDEEECDDEEDQSDEGHHPHPYGGGNGSCADAPCSCTPSHHRLARWGCLAALSLVLPCLLCYWPLQGGVKAVELCYQRCTRSGCRCDQRRRTPSTITSVHRSIAGQPQVSSHDNSTSKEAVISSQPLPGSGKRLLDI